MKLSTLLLSSAALVVAGSAYAADLPAKKGAPAAKAAGCPAFGTGFFQIPGGETCIKFSGYARLDADYTANTARKTAPYGLDGEYGFNVDARSNTDMGALRSYFRIENAATSRAYVQLGGLSAGAIDGPLNFSGGYVGSGQQFSGNGVGALTYSTGGFTVGITNSRDNNPSTSVAASRPDIIAAYSMNAGAVSVNVGAASHEAVGDTGGSSQGYALISSASFNAGAAKVTGYAAYAQGASSYLGGSSSIGDIEDVDTNGANPSIGSNIAAWVDVPLGTGSLGLYAGRVNIKNTAEETKETQYAVAYSFSPVKGLTVTPELMQTTTDDVASNQMFLRIQRDF